MTVPDVIFGAGALEELPKLVARTGARHPFLIASPGRRAPAERIQELLGSLAGFETRTSMHVQADAGAETAARMAAAGADLAIALGGGSAIGLAKACALQGGPPILAIPTTYSGSEMTPIWGITNDGAKITGRDERVRPRAVLYDPNLMLSFPPRFAIPSGFNAAAHCCEAVYAVAPGPGTASAALRGFSLLMQHLPSLVLQSHDVAVRTGVLKGAWLAGRALSDASMGLHHNLCHVLGGSYGLDHAGVHAVLLPYVLRYNAEAAAGAMERLAEVWPRQPGGIMPSQLPGLLFDLVRSLGAATGYPVSLRGLGLARADIPGVTAMVLSRSYPNPRRAEPESLSNLLLQSWGGIWEG